MLAAYLERVDAPPLGADAAAIGVPLCCFLERGCFLTLPLLDTAQHTLGVSAQVRPVDVAVGPQIRQLGLRARRSAVGLRRRRGVQRRKPPPRGPWLEASSRIMSECCCASSHDVIAASLASSVTRLL